MLSFSHLSLFAQLNTGSSCQFSTLPAKSSYIPRRSTTFVPKAASLSGSAAEFPEQLVGNQGEREKLRRRRSVAGIDQDELVDPHELGDADSFFCELNGVRIHHKICHHEDVIDNTEVVREQASEDSDHDRAGQVSRIGLPIILMHGFGASVFSWNRVMRPLARIVGSKVLAFDRPAFGLTSKISYIEQPKDGAGPDTRPLNPYSMAFSVLATLSFIDMLGASKAILMGHSAGCLVAIETYFEAPERVAALILVAPAIVAPVVIKRMSKDDNSSDDNSSDKEAQKKDETRNSVAQENPLTWIWQAFIQLFTHLTTFSLGILQQMRHMIRTLCTKVLSAILRSAFAVMLVRIIIDKFGILAIRNAWFDASQVTDHVLTGYTKPLKVKGWEIALLEYTLALLTDSASRPPLSKRLAQISCPVLIITGDTDRLVPAWNAKRLSEAIPGSSFEVIRNCGHLPHEEKVEEFLLVVDRFLQKVFGNPSKQLNEAAA